MCFRLPGGNRIISHVFVCKVLKQSATIVELISDSACHLLYIKFISSDGTMIGYNRNSFIYMQPIDDRMEFLGIDYNRKFF